MEKIYHCLNEYENQIKTNNNSGIEPQEILKINILQTKNLIFEFRKIICKKKFDKQQDEIHFFKNIKPQVCGKLKYYKLRLEYLVEMPFVSLKKQKDFIQNRLKLLEIKKDKFPTFYSYIKRGEDSYDDKYFIRNTKHPELYLYSDVADYDPEFSTSHDHLACEVVFYNLTIEFFKNELYRIQNNQLEFVDNPSVETNFHKLNWSASKTDLIELIYAFHCCSVLEKGDVDIKEITVYFENVFNISLGDVYRAFQDIRLRKINQTKFLDKLKESLLKKIDELES